MGDVDGMGAWERDGRCWVAVARRWDWGAVSGCKVAGVGVSGGVAIVAPLAVSTSMTSLQNSPQLSGDGVREDNGPAARGGLRGEDEGVSERC